MSRLRLVLDQYSKILDSIKQNDIKIFQKISQFCEDNIFYAKEIVAVTMAKLSLMPANKKIYLYYAIDFVLKTVGDEYKSLFESKLQDRFPKDMTQIARTGRDKKKEFLFLFLSWETCLKLNPLRTILKTYYELTQDVSKTYFRLINFQFKDLIKCLSQEDVNKIKAFYIESKTKGELLGLMKKYSRAKSMMKSQTEVDFESDQILEEKIKRMAVENKQREIVGRRMEVEIPQRDVEKKDDISSPYKIKKRVKLSRSRDRARRQEIKKMKEKEVVTQAATFQKPRPKSEMAKPKPDFQPKKAIKKLKKSSLTKDSKQSLLKFIKNQFKKNTSFSSFQDISLFVNLMETFKSSQTSCNDLELLPLEDFKQRNQHVMAFMFDKSKIFCPNCGLRFTKDDYPKHLDFHYMENFNKKKGKVRPIAGRYLTSDEWITKDDENVGLYNKKIEKKEEKEYIVTFSGENKSCIVCGEDFEVEWKSGINDWVLKNALLVNIEKPKEKEKSQVEKEKKEGKKKEEKSEVVRRICMHPECYSVLAVQDKKGDDYKGLGIGGQKITDEPVAVKAPVAEIVQGEKDVGSGGDS